VGKPSSHREAKYGWSIAAREAAKGTGKTSVRRSVFGLAFLSW
jgi:hypothetical protein